MRFPNHDFASKNTGYNQDQVPIRIRATMESISSFDEVYLRSITIHGINFD